MGSFYLSTPIYYASGEPHLGHAYTTILADVLARYHRRAGDDVLFLTGTDDHGQKIQEVAEEQGLTPLELCDRMAARFQAAWDDLGISNDRFIRTTEPAHKAVVSALLERLYDNGFIYESEYVGWYSVGQERYFTEKEIGPDRVDPIAGGPVTKIREKNHFFRMSLFRDRLVEHIEKNPEWISARHAPQRGARLPQPAARGPVDLTAAIADPLGHSDPLGQRPGDLCVGGRADQLRDRLRGDRSGRTEGPARVRRSAAVALALRRPPHGQGHHHHARRLLAHAADGCRSGAAPEDPGARMVGGRRHEDVQVAGQRGGSPRPARQVRHRRRALVSDEGNGDGSGCVVYARALRDPLRRAAQHLRQPGPPHPVDDQALPPGRNGSRGRWGSPSRTT